MGNLFVEFSYPGALSVALGDERNLEIFLSYAGKVPASRILPDLVGRALSLSQINFADLKKIVIGSGPGSFTSLRVLVSYIKGISYSLKIPVFTYSTFDWLYLYLKERGIPNSKIYIPTGVKDVYYVAEYSDLYFCKIYVERVRNLVIPLYEYELGAKYLYLISRIKDGKFFHPSEISKLEPDYVFPQNFTKMETIKINF